MFGQGVQHGFGALIQTKENYLIRIGPASGAVRQVSDNTFTICVILPQFSRKLSQQDKLGCFGMLLILAFQRTQVYLAMINSLRKLWRKHTDSKCVIRLNLLLHWLSQL